MFRTIFTIICLTPCTICLGGSVYILANEPLGFGWVCLLIAGLMLAPAVRFADNGDASVDIGGSLDVELDKDECEDEDEK